jgi:cation diffusion facilitator family transporter
MSTTGAGQRNLVVWAALAANLGIGIAKFVAAALTGSTAMLTEGIHSVVDSGNQVLLLYGDRRAKRPPDALHPFGYGRELYFWAFVVAILIFAVGAVVSIYEGWLHWSTPEPLHPPLINYLVLAVAFALEGTSWTIALREFGAAKGDVGWWQAVKDSKDPATFTVLFEDSAALAGLIVAAIGVWASHHFADPRLDGLASIVIGLILVFVAIFLAREAKGLLIGERADPKLVYGITRIVAAHPAVSSVNHVRTIHTAPKQVFVAISADFHDNVTMGDAEQFIEDIEDQLRASFPQLSSIYIRPEKREQAGILLDKQ